MSIFDLASMTDTEKVAHDRIVAGEVAQFDEAKPKPHIRAALLRALALRSPVCGVRVRGAHIEGDLDLSIVALPAVTLDDCEIPGRIDLSSARLGALSLQSSRFFHLSARGASIDGPFDFSAATPFASEAWIDASKAWIRGGVTARGARLKTPPKRPKDHIPARDHTFALRLSETEIKGNLWLSDHFVADGGVCLDEAHVHGTCSIVHHSSITPAEDDERHPGPSLNAYAFRCGGMMALNFGLHAQGRIFIINSKFGSRFNIDGSLNGTRGGYDWMGRAMNANAALMIENCEIGRSFALTKSVIDCGVSLSDSVFGGGILLAHTKITNKTPDGQAMALQIERTKIGQDLVFGPGFSAAGKVSLFRSEIDGDLDLSDTHIDNSTPDQRGMALDARRIRVKGELRPHEARAGQFENLSMIGKVDFEGAVVGP